MENKPRDLPILFQGNMVRTLLDDSKHQTSRVIKPPPLFCNGGYFTWRKGQNGYKGQRTADFCHELTFYARYRVGDRLWVREAWGLSNDVDLVLAKDGVTPGELDASTYTDLQIFYCATSVDNEVVFRCRPSIHMPRWASRINLEVTAVSAKRIQQISEDEAEDEGIGLGDTFPIGPARKAFQELWDSINAAPKLVKPRYGLAHFVSYPWDHGDNTATISKHRGKTHVIYGNPFVFVYKFNRIV